MIQIGPHTLNHGDCLEVMATMEAESIDAIVTDPPYGLAFMGKSWDHGVPGEPFWRQALRVAKPGTHLLAFGGTRTYHRLACAIEDAGWEIRDCIMWVYGSGFPKSLDVSKAIDAAAGAEREVVGKWKPTGTARVIGGQGSATAGMGSSGAVILREELPITAPATDAAKKWDGWGTALKPAWEPIIVARKPLAGTVAANVLAYGTGALNIDGCRVPHDGESLGGGRISTKTDGWDRPWKHDDSAVAACRERGDAAVARAEELGRFPANLIHDGSDEVTRLFPNEDGVSASRFFYAAKASRFDRDDGCDGMERRRATFADGTGLRNNGDGTPSNRNHHPTVKPTDLMRYLCRLVTPPDGRVLDPFAGSGSTGKAASLEGFRFTGIELDKSYIDIATARIRAAHEQFNGGPLFADK